MVPFVPCALNGGHEDEVTSWGPTSGTSQGSRSGTARGDKDRKQQHRAGGTFIGTTLGEAACPFPGADGGNMGDVRLLG